jgi:hypothetical protein
LLSIAIHHPTTDIYYHQKLAQTTPTSIWSFGSTSGVNAWSVDGTQLFREQLPNELPMCSGSSLSKNNSSTEESEEVPQCSFFVVAGKKE